MRDRALFHRVVVVAEALRSHRITHVHVPWASPDATVAMLAARLADVRYSVQARASDIHRRGAEHGRAERLHHAAFVITNTDYNRAQLQVMAPRARAVHVIRNGVDLRRFTPAPPPVNDPPRLLLVGRLTEPKGIDMLLRACARLRDAGQPLACELIGGRVDNEVNHYIALRKLHGALGLDGVVTFTGPLPFDQVLARYRGADVVVLPALEAADGRREITPNVLLEAMAMQRPVVSTPVGGIAEIVEDGVSGLLVPPRDPAALAAALLVLLRDPALRERLGRAGRLRVAERFDISRNIERFVELFRG
jgi:glycosyltransferase involved in cell wall biosynthesis